MIRSVIALLILACTPYYAFANVPDRTYPGARPEPSLQDLLNPVEDDAQTEKIAFEVYAEGRIVFEGEMSAWNLVVNKTWNEVQLIIYTKIPYERITITGSLAGTHFSRVRHFQKDDGSVMTLFTPLADECTVETFRDHTCDYNVYFFSVLNGIAALDIFESMYVDRFTFTEDQSESD